MQKRRKATDANGSLGQFLQKVPKLSVFFPSRIGNNDAGLSSAEMDGTTGLMTLEDAGKSEG